MYYAIECCVVLSAFVCLYLVFDWFLEGMLCAVMNFDVLFWFYVACHECSGLGFGYFYWFRGVCLGLLRGCYELVHFVFWALCCCLMGVMVCFDSL